MSVDAISIICPNCSAPARFDIVEQNYKCSYCGGKLEPNEVREAKQADRKERRIKLRELAKSTELMMSSCDGCGSTLVFEENEAVANCGFCGRSVVRKHYVYDDKMPENVVPFGVTRDEAIEKMEQWCKANSSKREARHLRPLIRELKGYYLPYEMISGPVYCNVRRLDDVTSYDAEGYIENGFINCSSQMDNLVLDAMEPYDLDQLEEFNFGYVAGHSVKMSDLSDEKEQHRIEEEVHENYLDEMNRIWNSRSLSLDTNFNEVIKAPVLLPAYYISSGNVCAAVNGQTGKVSVRAEKLSHHVTPPWWLKSLIIILAYAGLTYGLIWLECRDQMLASIGGAAELAFELFLFLFMIRDSYYHWGTHTTYRKIFTSGNKVFKRVQGQLVDREDTLKDKIAEPMFKRLVNKDTTEKVYYRFCPPQRMIGMVLLSFFVVLWPIILALFINGFDFNLLEIKASGIWLLITLPTVPVYLIRGAVQWLYESPWIYDMTDDGQLKRRTLLSKIKNAGSAKIFDTIKTALLFLIVPPISLAVWFALAILGMSVYFTAFGM